MAGTKAGGLKAVQTTKKRHGEDFYRGIGIKGAKAYNKKNINGTAKPRGFAVDPNLARKAGAVGGKISKRGKARLKK